MGTWLLGLCVSICLLLVPTRALASPTANPPLFQISDIVRRADLDEKRVAAAEQRPYPSNSDLWLTRNGHYTVYKLMAPSWGVCADERPCMVHHILLLAVDKPGTIVKGYYFVLEWAEPPTPICRIRAKGKKLSSKLKVSDLELECTGADRVMTSGLIDNIYKAQKAFP